VKENEWDSTDKFLIKRCHNGLSIRYRNPNNPEMFMDTVIENKDDDLKHSIECLWFLMDILNLNYEDRNLGSRIQIKIVNNEGVDLSDDMN